MTKRVSAIAAIVFCSCAISNISQANPVLDQSFIPDLSNGALSISYYNSVAQDFTVGISGELTSVALGLHEWEWYNKFTGTVQVSITGVDAGGAPLGASLASASITSLNLPYFPDPTPFTLFTFSKPLEVTANERLSIIASTKDSGVLLWDSGNGQSNTSFYSTSGYFHSVGGASELAFATYVDANATSVPEPGSLAILGLGLFGLGMATNGRRRMNLFG